MPMPWTGFPNMSYTTSTSNGSVIIRVQAFSIRLKQPTPPPAATEEPAPYVYQPKPGEVIVDADESVAPHLRLLLPPASPDDSVESE